MQALEQNNSASPRTPKATNWQMSLKVKDWESSYRCVNNLLLHLSRKTKSESSKKLYLSHLHRFCNFTGKKPNQLVTLKTKQVEKYAQAYADTFKDTSPRYANLAITALKAFFTSNGFTHTKALELETYHAPSRFRVTPEYIPSKTEVYRMADSAGSLRDRAMILTMFSAGLRNSTLRSIRYKDIKTELAKNQTNLLIPIYPEMKQVDPNACKGGFPYYTFTSDEATQAIKLCINEREDRYGKFEDDEPLFCTSYNQITRDERKKRPPTSRELQLVTRSTAKKAGIADWQAVHPHCLRKAYETVLHSQLIDGANLNVKVGEFFMGHKLPGSQDPYFDRSKIEHMKMQYQRLKFGRATVENRFKLLKSAVARVFEETGIDPEQVIEEYIKMKHQNEPSNQNNQDGGN